jgi:REP element-mobilizing transposase RayT
VVWCPKYRRRLLDGRVAVALWSSSFFVASVDSAVSANTAEQYINTQWERPRTGKGKQEDGSAPGV